VEAMATGVVVVAEAEAAAAAAMAWQVQTRETRMRKVRAMVPATTMAKWATAHVNAR
jgi:regulator of RNase E activity RraA